MKHLQYLKYLIKHKWFVFVAGRKVRAPLWRLIIHDWSKFLPSEWVPYVQSFYGTCGTGHKKRDKLCVFCASRKEAFDTAWLHHQHFNPHHWQHWLLQNDDGTVKAIEMPINFTNEMVADWAGAGRAITGKWDVVRWYMDNREKMKLHEQTRKLVESRLAWNLSLL